MHEGQHENGLGSKEALFSIASVKSDRDSARFWRSVFGKTAETLVSQWPEVFWELQHRIPRLERLFAKLEGLSISSDTLPRPGMERDFKREKVLRIVALQFADAARIKRELAGQAEEVLRRCEQDLRRLLVTSCLLSQDELIVKRLLERTRRVPALADAQQEIKTQLALMHKEVQQELAELKENRKKINGKCGALSQMITELATHLRRCQLIGVFYPSTARQYALIQDIIVSVTAPSCLACGQRHELKDWRAVRARDRGKGRRVQIVERSKR